MPSNKYISRNNGVGIGMMRGGIARTRQSKTGKKKRGYWIVTDA